MRKRFYRQVMCFTLAIMLVVGMMPGIAMTAHANTTITQISVKDIAEPVIGETPDYSASVPADAAYYIGTDITGMNSDINGILWVNNSTSPISKDVTFAEDGSYDVRMEIYAKDGVAFAAKENLIVTVNGQTAHVISRTDTMIYIRYTFGAPTKKQTITSIELYHDSDVEAKNGTKNLQVSKINGEAFDGEAYAGFQWYRSTSNFSDINESGVTAWDDAKDGYKFVGGYAYGLRINSLPDIDGYAYGPTVVVSLKMPSYSKMATIDGNGNCYFYFDKLVYKPDLEAVDVSMDGYYLDANVMNLTFFSNDPIRTEGGYGVNTGRYTIRKYNSETQQYDVLSSTPFVAGEKYYLFFYLESDLDVEGLARENIKVNGNSAVSKGKENGRTYYMFSLPILKEGATCNGTDHDFEKVLVPATIGKDGKIYEICTKGCDTVRNETVIPRIKSVKLSKSYYVYDGTTKKPTVTVKDRTGKTLVKDKDYKVIYPTYSKRAALYVVDVVMKGNYEGMESMNFQILPAVKTVELSYSSTVYSGKTKSPSVTVKDSTGKKLVKNSDYTVTVPKGRTSIGKYTYTVQFKGKYADLKSKKLTLTIKPAKPTIYTPKAAKKAITVKWKKASKSQTTGYQVMVATDSSFKKNVKKTYVTGYSKTSYKMTNLKAKTKYYVRVRTYKTVKGEKIYSSWSKVKTIKSL